MKSCADCGLGIKESNELIRCFKYKTLNDTFTNKEECFYFIGVISEEDEILTPLQHLLLKEENIKARMMKGVV